MPYIPPSVVREVKRMDLLTYLKNYEPYELVHFSGNTYTTRTHDSLKISNGKWMWWSHSEIFSLFGRCEDGLKVKAGSGTEVIPRWQEILFSLTGEIMERLTTLEL